MSELLVTNIGMLATPLGSAARKGPEQGQIQVLKDAWVLIRDERVAQVGSGPAPAAICQATHVCRYLCFPFTAGS